jgi:hypothetical protein
MLSLVVRTIPACSSAGTPRELLLVTLPLSHPQNPQCSAECCRKAFESCQAINATFVQSIVRMYTASDIKLYSYITDLWHLMETDTHRIAI